MKVQVVSQPLKFGHISLTSCKQVWDDPDQPGKIVKIMFSREAIDSMNIQRGSFVTICEPWKTVTVRLDEGPVDVILCTNHAFTVTSPADVELARGLAMPQGQVGVGDASAEGLVIWRDVVSEVDALSSQEESQTTTEAPVKTSLSRTSISSSTPAPLRSSSSRCFSFLPSKSQIKEEDTVHTNIKVSSFSAIKPSFSSKLAQRHNITIYLIYCLLPPPSTSSPTSLFCLDATSALHLVSAASLDSFAPSVLASLRRNRRLYLRLEGVVLLGATYVIDQSGCIFEAYSPSFPHPRPDGVDPILHLPSFSSSITPSHSGPNHCDLVSFTGRISSIDMDNAFSESICPACCRFLDDTEADADSINCKSCHAHTVPTTRVTLHVFVIASEMRSRCPVVEPQTKLKLVLLDSYARRLLEPAKGDSDHHDVNRVLEHPLKDIPCLVEPAKLNQRPANVVVLKQVTLFD